MTTTVHADGTDVVDAFFAETIAALRTRLVPSNDSAEFCVYEDVVALLTDYRLSDMDARAFETMILRMGGGRAPVAMPADDAVAIAGWLSARWAAYRRAHERR